MRIVGYIIEGWLGLSAVVTLGWVLFYELAARRVPRAGRPRRAAPHPADAHAPRARLSKIVAVPTTGEQPSSPIESDVSHAHRRLRANTLPTQQRRAATKHRP